MNRLIALVAVCLLSTTLASAEPIKFARYPHVSQGKLVFSYHGDVWIANENGSNPQRLTAHVARDVFPRLSPDGRWVAFSSDRYGNNDVGFAQRLFTFQKSVHPGIMLLWRWDCC